MSPAPVLLLLLLLLLLRLCNLVHHAARLHRGQLQINLVCFRQILLQCCAPLAHAGFVLEDRDRGAQACDLRFAGDFGGDVIMVGGLWNILDGLARRWIVPSDLEGTDVDSRLPV